MPDLKTTILVEGMKKVLDDAKVPQRVHLQVISELAKALKAHKEDIARFAESERSFLAQIDARDNLIEEYKNKFVEWGDLIDEFLSRDWTGPKGDKPVAGIDFKIPRAPQAPDIMEVARLASEFVELPLPVESMAVQEPIDKEKMFQEFVSRIQKERLIDVSNIRNSEAFIFNTKNKKVTVKFEELMRGAGGATSSGGALTSETVTGVLNGVNTSYSIPTAFTGGSIIILNQATYVQGTDYTVSGTAITFSVAPPDFTGYPAPTFVLVHA